MILAGKTSPEYVNITSSVHNSFTHLELHLDKKHLDNVEITKENITAARENLKEINKTFTIISIHTPHFEKGEHEYLKKTLELSKEYDAYTIFHSNQLSIEQTLEIAKNHTEDKLLIENKTTMDLKSIVHNILPYHDLALDIAHLYRGSQNIYHDLEILITTYKKKIKLLHLNDSTKQKDGLPIGDGDIDYPTIACILKKTGYDNPMIIETPKGTQQESRKKIEKFMM